MTVDMLTDKDEAMMLQNLRSLLQLLSKKLRDAMDKEALSRVERAVESEDTKDLARVIEWLSDWEEKQSAAKAG